ncbi:MAG: YciI family protein [Polaromonas sp.]|nr:YciI family protein [Polaromonas sp.]
MPAKDAALQQTGHLVWSGSLQGPKATFGLRPRGGKPVVSDGPYSQAKELVGGFFVIEAADKEEAVRIASLHPAATLGEHIWVGDRAAPDRYLFGQNAEIAAEGAAYCGASPAAFTSSAWMRIFSEIICASGLVSSAVGSMPMSISFVLASPRKPVRVASLPMAPSGKCGMGN